MNARSVARKAYTGRLPFECVIRTALPLPTLWNEIELGFTRSESSQIWPGSLETVSAEGLVAGSIVRATYKMLWMHRTFHYKITEYEPGEKITYVALQDHVFEGGATVSAVATPEGSILRWAGEYLFHPDHALEAAAFRFYFRDRFFGTLQEGIRHFERELGEGAMVLN